jgi:hypothetical protein
MFQPERNTMKRICAIVCLITVAGSQLSRLDAADPEILAHAIDSRLQARFEAEQIAPAPGADDAEFFRRLNLDLVGSIPTAVAAQDFLRDTDDNKRAMAIDRLLESPEHAEHFANVWRALLLPEAETDRQLRYFLPGFELWLRQRRAENVGFDVIVRDLLTVPITGTEERPQHVLTNLQAANPMAFIAAKEADPGKLAATSTRLFLGIRLECAQCHNHPFDQWTQEQFWNQAAFFAGIQRKGRGPFAPVFESPDTKSIALMNDASNTVPAVFLDGHDPEFHKHAIPRTVLAQWMTSSENPFFARATVNRVWGQLMGYGIVNPVDDFGDSNPPSHPELLSDLTLAFTSSGYNLTELYRSICRTEAYQRTSQQTDSQQSEPSLFAKMAIKPMSGEQFYDSLVQAIRSGNPAEPQKLTRNEDPTWRRFLDTFGQQGDQSNPDTSVLQALTLMNGSLIGQATHAESGEFIQALSAKPSGSNFDSLYLATLSRLPTDEEKIKLDVYVSEATEPEYAQRLGDVLWMLLNSAEFRWNH